MKPLSEDYLKGWVDGKKEIKDIYGKKAKLLSYKFMLKCSNSTDYNEFHKLITEIFGSLE